MIMKSTLSIIFTVLHIYIFILSWYQQSISAVSVEASSSPKVIPTHKVLEEHVTTGPDKERVTIRVGDLTEISTKKPLQKKESIRKPTTTLKPEVVTKTLYRLNSDEGTACILLRTDAVVTFSYTSVINEKYVRDIYVPEHAEIGGDCSEDTSRLELKWIDFKLIWYFEKTPGGERWFVNQIELVFDGLSTKLQHIKNPDQEMTLSTPKSHSALLFVTPVGQAYTCLRDVEILLTNSNTDVKATVLLRELEIQPFLFKDNNFGPEYVCPAPGQGNYRSETAPLIVGSILAAACLGTVTGYSMFRYFKIKKVQYDTME